MDPAAITRRPGRRRERSTDARQPLLVANIGEHQRTNARRWDVDQPAAQAVSFTDSDQRLDAARVEHLVDDMIRIVVPAACELVGKRGRDKGGIIGAGFSDEKRRHLESWNHRIVVCGTGSKPV